MGYSFQLAARVLLYAPSHRQDNIYHSLCYTSRGALAGTRNSSMGPPWGINLMTHHTTNLHLAPKIKRGKEMLYLIMHSKTFELVVWHWVHGKGPFRWETKPAVANLWAILSNEQQEIFHKHHPTGRTVHTSRGILAGIGNTLMCS